MSYMPIESIGVMLGWHILGQRVSAQSCWAALGGCVAAGGGAGALSCAHQPQH